MSVKGSSKKIKLSYMFPVFAVGTAAATAVRLWQVFNIIEPDTGFYSEKNFTVMLLYAVLAVTSVALFFIAYLAEKVPESRMPEGKHIGTAIVSLAVSVSLVYDAIVCFGKFASYYSSYFTSVQTQKIGSYLMKTGAIPIAFEGFFALISAVFFVLLSVKYFIGKLDISKYKLLAVCPVFWATGRIVQRFTRTISFVNVSDLLLELFMIAFLMMFLMNFAQMNSNINARAVVNKVYAYGLISAVFALVVSVPKIFVMIFAPQLNVLNNPLEYCSITLPVFTIFLLCAMETIPKVKNITVREAEKEAHSEKKNNREED